VGRFSRMATRNLTKKFVEIRNASKANRHLKSGDDSSDETLPHKGLLNQNSDSTTWRASKGKALPPRWVEDIENAEDTISKIEIKIKELSALHNKRLMVNFESDEAQQEREIDYKTQEITNLFRNAERILQKFSRADKSSAIPPSELTVRTNIQRSIAKKLQGLSMSFRSTQKEYLNRLKTQKTENGNIFDFETSKGGVEPFEVDTDTGFTAQQRAMVDDTEELVNQRDQEIAHIAKSIEELAAIFKELAVLVIDQGTILDRIDYNMESAVEHAQEGIKQLVKAEEHQKNALPFRCIVLLVVLIAIMLVVLIVKHTSSK